MRRALRRAWNERGLSLIEVLIAGVIVAIVGVGVALMFSTGQAYVNTEGDNRVSLFLAQQKVEQMRALGGALVPTGVLTTEVLVPCSSGQPLFRPSIDATCVPPASVTKTYTRTWVVVCLLASDYSRTPEGCAQAQYPTMAKLIIVCVVEGAFTRVCDTPMALTTTAPIDAAVRASQLRPAVLYSVMSPRF